MAAVLAVLLVREVLNIVIDIQVGDRNAPLYVPEQ